MDIHSERERKHSKIKKEISVLELLQFFIPLGITQLLISFSHSLFNAVLTKLSSPEVYLAAFAVAKSVMQVLQNPVAMIKQTVGALINDDRSYFKVKKFVIGMILTVVVFFYIFTFAGGARWVLHYIMGVEDQILEEVIIILKVFILLPIAIGAREFLQGIAIKFKMTPVVTIGTLARVIFAGMLVLFVEKLVWIPGGILAGGMFLAAAMIESGTLFIIIKKMVKNIPYEMNQLYMLWNHDENKELTNSYIFHFFWPLVVTSFVRTLTMPVINSGLARTVRPELALASFSIAWGVGIIFLSPLMMIHQVSLNYVHDGDDLLKIKSLRGFAICCGVVLSFIIAGIAFTPVGYYIIRDMIGASEEISILAADVLKYMTLLPYTYAIRQYYWGLLMKWKKTMHISRGRMINLTILFPSIFIAALFNPSNPATVGVIGIIVSEVFESVYLYWVCGKRREFMGS